MPATVDLTEVLHVEDIHLHFKAASVIEAIPLLLRPALVRRFGQREVVDEIVAAVIEREKDTTTRCGPLALPHARSASLDTFLLSLGANAEGTIEGHSDPRLIFAFVSPEGKREQHLQLLATLARLSQNAKVVDQIATASNIDQVIDVLRSAGV